jgi:transposase
MIDRTVPADKEIYLICDNYATHKHERVQRWLEKHKRFHVRFTPTSASWLNMVERFFRDITHNRIRRGVFQDLEQLIMAIGNYIDVHNQNPKPFIWLCQEEALASCCMGDEGRPLGAALQGEASNSRKLLQPNGCGGERCG